MPRRGFGELGRDEAITNAEREVFLGIVKQEAPAFFQDLRDRVLPYRLDSADPYDDPRRRAREGLEAWAHTYFADLEGNKWLLEFANALVSWWIHKPDDAKKLEIQWALPSSPLTAYDPEEFRFVALWHPEMTKWKAFESQAASAFFKQLESYHRGQEARFSKNTDGVDEATGTPYMLVGAKKGAVIKDQDRRDFIWLARYQFLGKSWGALSRTEPRAAWQNIQRRAKAAANRIGLQLRPNNAGGRPAPQR